jgi:hypothetical protein
MKKVLIGMLVVAVALGFAVNAYSAEYKETTEVKTKGDTTTETTKVKAGDVKAEEKVTTTSTSTTTEEKMKGKNVKMEKTTTDTAKGETGTAKVDIKKGELKKLSIDWVYYRQGPEYIIEYDVKKMKTGKVDEDIKTDLNLTDDQFKLITPGKHTITSTSPYTADDVKNDFRSVIIKDLASSVKK